MIVVVTASMPIKLLYTYHLVSYCLITTYSPGGRHSKNTTDQARAPPTKKGIDESSVDSYRVKKLLPK